jgi:hypothetical protein
MKQGLTQASLAALLMATLAACSPGLNWREVELGRLRTLMPCKPDRASRPVVLAGQTLSMEVTGCEAEGTLFAISRTQSTDAAQASALLLALRQASLENVHMRVVQPMANSGDAHTSFDLLVQGQRPDGSPLQARFKWLQADAEVYQIAAFAGHLGAEQTDNLVNEVRLR